MYNGWKTKYLQSFFLMMFLKPNSHQGRKKSFNSLNEEVLNLAPDNLEEKMSESSSSTKTSVKFWVIFPNSYQVFTCVFLNNLQFVSCSPERFSFIWASRTNTFMGNKLQVIIYQTKSVRV